VIRRRSYGDRIGALALAVAIALSACSGPDEQSAGGASAASADAVNPAVAVLARQVRFAGIRAAGDRLDQLTGTENEGLTTRLETLFPLQPNGVWPAFFTAALPYAACLEEEHFHLLFVSPIHGVALWTGWKGTPPQLSAVEVAPLEAMLDVPGAWWRPELPWLKLAGAWPEIAADANAGSLATSIYLISLDALEAIRDRWPLRCDIDVGVELDEDSRWRAERIVRVRLQIADRLAERLTDPVLVDAHSAIDRLLNAADPAPYQSLFGDTLARATVSAIAEEVAAASRVLPGRVYAPVAAGAGPHGGYVLYLDSATGSRLVVAGRRDGGHSPAFVEAIDMGL
jgi:hypothetical protein